MTTQLPYEPVPARHHATLTPPEPSDVLVNAAPGPDGQLVVLWCDPHTEQILSERRTAPNGVRYSPTMLDEPVTVRVTTHHPDLVHTTTITDLSLPSPHVQPLPGGRVLLVGARCRWYGDHADRNAVIYDSDGGRVGDGVLGDGIGRLATTSAGRIWAGYFDEGIVGNYGWGGPQGPVPVGAPGLVCFDDTFRPV